MALGRRCRDSRAKSEFVGFGTVRSTTGGLGRKRIGISKDVEIERPYEEFSSPLKRQCSGKFELEETESQMSHLENLPQELLIRVLCGVEHSDLRQLMCVSKPVMEATLVAKSLHFAYNTPSKVKAFCEIDDLGDEIEAPNAPRHVRKRGLSISQKAKEELTVALFQSDDEEGSSKWPRRLSFMEEDEER